MRHLRMLLLFVLLAFSATTAGAQTSDAFLAERAMQALESGFPDAEYSLSVRDGIAYIDLADDGNTGAIVETLERVHGVRDVVIANGRECRFPFVQGDPGCTLAFRKDVFAPLLADPRWPHLAASYAQYQDDPELASVGLANFGGNVGIVRGRLFAGTAQLNVRGGVFSIFDLDAASNDLVNSDFLVGIPVAYRRGDVSLAVQVAHQSSHLGDEFILRNPVERVNLSYEWLGGKLSYEVTPNVRAYAGPDYIFHRNPPELEPFMFQYGVEWYCPSSFFRESIQPVAAVDLKHWEQHDYAVDVSARTGIRIFSAAQNRQDSRLFVFLEYFVGHSPNGQFFERTIEYWGFGLHYFL